MICGVKTLNAQNPGVDQPEQSALELAYQEPLRWRGMRFSERYSFLERSYISVGFGTESIFGMAELVDGNAWGYNNTITFGQWVNPILGFEVGASYGKRPYGSWNLSRLGDYYSVPTYQDYYSINIAAIFSFSSFAHKLQSPKRFEFSSGLGFSLAMMEGSSLGLRTWLRMQYNISPSVGIYVEPKIGVSDNNLDSEELGWMKAHFTTAVTGGFSVKLFNGKESHDQRLERTTSRRLLRNNQDSLDQVAAIYPPIDPALYIVDEEAVGDVVADSLVTKSCSPIIISTNLLNFLMAKPNIEVEVPFMGDKYSAALSYTCPWFGNRAAGYMQKMKFCDIEARYWFNPFSIFRKGMGRDDRDFYIAAGVGFGTYDFASDGEGEMGRSLVQYGASLGYRYDLGANVSANISIGFGITSDNYDTYYEDEGCLVHTYTRTETSLGITKFNIGLSWRPTFKSRKGVRGE